MICSSVNIDRFMVRSSRRAGLYHQLEGKPGVTAEAISERGYAAQQVDAEITADCERANGLGLAFGQTAVPQQKEAADG